MNEQELRTNKQELISKYELIKNSYNFDTVATDSIISDLKRLDEPEKVKVPQFVDDVIEGAREHSPELEARNLQNGIKRNPTEISSLVHGLTATRSRKRKGIM